MNRLSATLISSLTFFVLAPSTTTATIVIDTVPVGNPGNANDPSFGNIYGGVSYNYRIGTTEVTNTQYTAFLNAVAATDTNSLFSPAMDGSVHGGITRTGGSGSYSYSVKPGYENFPVNYVSWPDAARFANWLANGQPTGAQNHSTTEAGTYYLNYGNTPLQFVTRSANATVFIPNQNEWYKAAYYDPTSHSYFAYPTSSDTVPSNSYVDAGNNANFYANLSYTTGTNPFLTNVGHFATSASPYGTFDQAGNVKEWNEDVFGTFYRPVRGGAYDSGSNELLPSYNQSYSPATEEDRLGFRVASIAIVPEPSTLFLSIFGLTGLVAWVWRRKRSHA